jgi:hypothetical protein
MPRSPDDNEKREPTRKSKRARRTSTPHHTNATTARLGGEIDAAAFTPEVWEAVEMLLRLRPLRMLASVIVMVLRDRVTSEELQLICKLYHTALMLRPAEGSDGE